MASDRLATSTGTRPKDALAAYLSDLAAQLRGPRRRREAMLTELRDGLEQVTEDRIATGLASDRAAAGAITQSEARAPLRTRSLASWQPRTRAAPSPVSLRPARSWESGGCSCFIQALGAPA